MVLHLAGQLLGSKLVLNEFVAFGQLGEVIKTLIQNSFNISISLCGFANIIYGYMYIWYISILSRKKKPIIKIAFRGMIGGFLVSLLSALMVGLILAF